MINILQLTLNLAMEPAYNVEDFLVSPCNQEAWSWIGRWPDWPSPGILLYGPSGCGKTHLGHIWGEKTQAQFLNFKELRNANLSDLFDACKHFILDDLNPRGEDEGVLFHLYNLAKERHGSLLFLSRVAPSGWNLKLADLASRMNAVPAVKIESPDDQFLKTLAFKLFSDQQLTVSDAVIDYLLAHGERSFKGVQTNVAKINAQALASRRNITAPFVRDVLKG